MRAKLYLLDDQIINVGDWDLQLQEIMDEVPAVDEEGEPIFVDGIRANMPIPTGKFTATNPIPEGAEVIENGEYALTRDGRAVQASDYVALRKAEYPPSVDYLDAVVKDDQEALQNYIAQPLVREFGVSRAVASPFS
jgi:hypothetical protein